MKSGELLINGECAWTKYGLYLADGAIAALWTPPPTKDAVQSEVRTENGTRTEYDADGKQKWDRREFTLEANISAGSLEALAIQMDALTETLRAGEVKITTRYEQKKTYRCRYESCQSLNVYGGTGRVGAKLLIKFEEPNPGNREA